MDLRGGRKPRGGLEDPVQLSPPELDHVEVGLPGQGPKKVDLGMDRPDAVHELRIAAPPPGENSVEGLHAPQAALRRRVAFDAGVLQGQGAVGIAKGSGERQIDPGHPKFQPVRAEPGPQPSHGRQRQNEVADGAGNDR